MMRELALNNPVESIKLSQSVDPWLSCHLTDLFSRMGILSEESRMMDQDEQEDFNTLDSDLRFESIENYASYLLEDQGLWRIALDYLSQNQVEDDSGANSKLNRARRAMRAVIMKVPVLGTMKGKARQLDDDRVVEDDDGESEVAKQQVEKDEFETADELIEACDFFNLQKEKRLICKVSDSLYLMFLRIQNLCKRLIRNLQSLPFLLPPLFTENRKRTIRSVTILSIISLCNLGFRFKLDSTNIRCGPRHLHRTRSQSFHLSSRFLTSRFVITFPNPRRRRRRPISSRFRGGRFRNARCRSNGRR